MVNKLELFLAVFFRGNDPDFLLLLILFFLELEVEVEKFEGCASRRSPRLFLGFLSR